MMTLHGIVTWYQKKIGTYDKQLWEKTVEQKILNGFDSVTLKNAKLKTELIDVDLVRGSTFPKAKPKQSLLTVIRLAIVRYLFLPLFPKWWVAQTSPKIFAVLLLLYITQLLNFAIYTLNANTVNIAFNKAIINDTMTGDIDICTKRPAERTNDENIISMAELIIPMGLGLLLSLIHSHIVATNSTNDIKTAPKEISNPMVNNKVKRDTRPRKRRRIPKIRIQENANESPGNVLNATALHPKCVSFGEKRNNSINDDDALTSSLRNTDSDATITASKSLTFPSKVERNADNNKTFPSVVPCSYLHDAKNNDGDEEEEGESIIHLEAPIISPKLKQINIEINDQNNIAPLIIDDSVREFYDDLLQRAALFTKAPINYDKADEGGGGGGGGSIENHYDYKYIHDKDRKHGQHSARDDGFESLNGKSSSGEETYQLINTPCMQNKEENNACKNRLRLRLHSNGNSKNVESNSGNIPTMTQSRIIRRQEQYLKNQSSGETDEETEDEDESQSSPTISNSNLHYSAGKTPPNEWLGVNTNSEECSYSSGLDNSDEYKNHAISEDDYNRFDLDITPAIILNPQDMTADRVSCTIWNDDEIKKAQMSVLEISSCIIERVESMPETNDYIYIGIFSSFILSLVPSFCRLCEVTISATNPSDMNYLDIPKLLWQKASFSLMPIFCFAFGHTQWEHAVILIGFVQRLFLTIFLFIIFAVAERTFKQRFLYAKLFSHLTSSRRAKKSNVPHFRLNKVRNIKTWLSIRSYLKRRGPQRSVDIIVSAAFIVTLFLLAFLSVEWLKDEAHLHSHLHLEALMWSTAIGIFLLRFMTLGNKIHEKYRSVSVLITEQINLYLQIERKPKKKEELMVSNSVLKLAADLLKELDTPFKISGLSANPYLFTTIKVVILSALSGVLSEMLGFKLKLHKIKIK